MDSSTKDVGQISDNWNVAGGFANIKILRPLILLDRYDVIAMFGAEEPEEIAMLDLNSINQRRIDGINRFFHTLKMVLGNAKFVVRQKSSSKVDILLSRIKAVGEVIPHSYEIYEDEITHQQVIEIHEDKFKKCLEVLEDIKDDLNIPLNEANLIFRASEEFDIEKIMHDIEEGG